MAAPRCIENLEKMKKECVKVDGYHTNSSIEQEKVEAKIGEIFEKFATSSMKIPKLQRDKHLAYLNKGLKNLSESYQCLDASRPWLCYWILHSLELLGEKISEEHASQVAQFIGKCQHPEGGFAGGPGQYAHLAPTYAAVLALATIGTKEAYEVVNREKLASFLMRMRSPDGGFLMHEGGEIDVRGAYCAAVAARLTNIATTEMFEGTPEWIASCQTYEGGFAGIPGMEAHGGYTFCAVAALVLMGHDRLCDTEALIRWLSNRQMRFEGGFQGRTNKHVDGCYSLWQGGVFPLIHKILNSYGDNAVSTKCWMFDQNALQEYILICCQSLNGGLIDKPGKVPDYYHTCYCLSGLSVAQHFASGNLATTSVLGDPSNELVPVHPVYNIGVECAFQASKHYSTLPVPSL
ncbi:protein farnesyltransferase subunit beta-like [Anneissia japonica]|uniref:protein farnesyltransferase subunit beta-like n=1 Tax=Anneissia japonica TaxID=1529436 RepID=UPI0014255204|nr:protein farnesyltransferase subunit beta-like [Anneissia japonica]